MCGLGLNGRIARIATVNAQADDDGDEEHEADDKREERHARRQRLVGDALLARGLNRGGCDNWLRRNGLCGRVQQRADIGQRADFRLARLIDAWRSALNLQPDFVLHSTLALA